jgi:phosphatidylglycerophosphate synthase
MTEAPENRRPLASRDTGWARAAAAGLARLGASPDLVSAFSVVFALAGFGLFLWSGRVTGGCRAAALVGAAVCIQLRLLANLLDGMVAVEHGRGGHAGPIWNELPDRFADVLFLVGAGYAAQSTGWPWAGALGWTAAVLAVMTAYVRELGRGLGFAADFRGPMAKPHRMATLTAACVVSAAEPLWGWRGQALLIGLGVIVAGAVITLGRRTAGLSGRLKARKQS